MSAGPLPYSDLNPRERLHVPMDHIYNPRRVNRDPDQEFQRYYTRIASAIDSYQSRANSTPIHRDRDGKRVTFGENADLAELNAQSRPVLGAAATGANQAAQSQPTSTAAATSAAATASSQPASSAAPPTHRVASGGGGRGGDGDDDDDDDRYPRRGGGGGRQPFDFMISRDSIDSGKIIILWMNYEERWLI